MYMLIFYKMNEIIIFGNPIRDMMPCAQCVVCLDFMEWQLYV